MKVLVFFVCHPVLFGQGIHKRIDQMCCFVVATVSGQLKSIKKEKKMKEILTMKHSPTCHRLRKQRLNSREVHLEAHGRPLLESGKLEFVPFPFLDSCFFLLQTLHHLATLPGQPGPDQNLCHTELLPLHVLHLLVAAFRLGRRVRNIITTQNLCQT